MKQLFSLFLLTLLLGCASVPTDSDKESAKTASVLSSFEQMEENSMVAFVSLRYRILEVHYGSSDCAKSKQVLAEITKTLSAYGVPRDSLDNPFKNVSDEKIKELRTKLKPLIADWYRGLSSIKHIAKGSGAGSWNGSYATAWITRETEANQSRVQLKYSGMLASSSWEEAYFERLNSYRVAKASNLTGDEATLHLVVAANLHRTVDAADARKTASEGQKKDTKSCEIRVPYL